ncbi:hypothetical protein SEPCBS119000_004702, partial [Sporothrix epigloea]
RVLPLSTHAENLFPAYIYDGEPIPSLWYGSKKMLQEERAALERNAAPLQRRL